ncbi:stress response protein Nst1 [Streptococcus uberis]|uniref:stress response protein Nst1 n=1 Tax=Streptococcus uberis TaxID=1349 RepID=UPI0027DB56D3|nr:stress response protein Nst1 [Streptococcus uberis]MCK1235481.1 stress response protein Nst1 [Streptococcus uberis]
MVTRIDDLGKYYAELSVKAEQNKAEKEAERVRLVNERAERERAKRDAQNQKLQSLLAGAMQMEIDEKKCLGQVERDKRIKDLEKQLEKDGAFKSDESIKLEEGMRAMLKSLNDKMDDD